MPFPKPSNYTLLSFDVPGAAYTSLRGINDQGEITGGYGPNNAQTNAFVDDGGIVTDLVSAPYPIHINYANAVNYQGQVVVASYTHYGPFTANSSLYPDGTSLPEGYASGINNHSEIVGSSFEGDRTVGIVYSPHSNTWTELDPAGSPAESTTSLNGINNRGDIVGSFSSGFSSATLNAQGFLYAHDRLTFIDYPGATSTLPQAINDSGVIVGSYSDQPGIQQQFHGFIDIHGKLMTLDFPNATSTQIFGINNHDQIVGTYEDNNGSTHGFIGYLGKNPGELAAVIPQSGQG